MTDIKKIIELYKNGDVELLYKKGFISNSVYIYFTIYNEFKERRERGEKNIADELAFKYKRSPQAIYKAIKLFNEIG